MSASLVEYARRFLKGRVAAEVFAESYLELWRIERDLDLLRYDDRDTGEMVSAIFSATEAFCSADDRLDCEIDESMLRNELRSILKPENHVGP